MISREKLVQLYSAMVKSRLIAERTTELAQQGKLPQDWEIGAGSEATLCGSNTTAGTTATAGLSNAPAISGAAIGENIAINVELTYQD